MNESVGDVGSEVAGVRGIDHHAVLNAPPDHRNDTGDRLPDGNGAWARDDAEDLARGEGRDSARTGAGGWAGDPARAEIATLPPEDLRCPSCGYGVYGLPENRCPECGQGFTWRKVRAISLRLRSGLFENRWLDNPAGSLLHTWGLAIFRPRTLWASYDVQTPPRVWPLVVFLLLQALLFSRSWQILAVAVDPLMNYLAERLASSPQTQLRFTYLFRPGPRFFVDMAVWYLAAFGLLQLLLESKGRCGIRWGHILRVHVHATAFASIAILLWFVIEWGVDASLFIWRRRVTQDMYDNIGRAVFMVVLVITWLQLWLGYRRHLQMPHAGAVAGAALLIGFLTVRVTRMLF